MPAYYLSANRDSVQEEPFILSLRNGNILGLWTDLEPDPGVGGTFGVYGRTLAGDLGGAGSDIRIPDLTEDIQGQPVATLFADGSFAVAFNSKGPSAIDGTDDAWYDSYVKFYDANGTPRGAAKQITPNTTDDHYPDEIATLANDQSLTLVARYESAGNYDLIAYRHDSTGRQIGGPVRLVDDAPVYVNSITGAGYIGPSLAASRDGNYAVSWHQETDQGGGLRGYAVWTQVFRPDGTPVAAARITAPLTPDPDTSTGADQRGSEIAARNIGGYALGWMREDGEVGAETDVYFRLLGADGSTLTNPVHVTAGFGPGDKVLQDVVDLGEGRTLITFFHQIPDAIDDIYDGGVLYGRVMGPRGSGLTSAFRITDDGPYEDMGEGNTIINQHGQIVSTFSTEITYADDEDVMIVARSLTLPQVSGTSGNDRMIGTLVNDQLSGGAGHDNLSGGRGNDRLLGGSGNDVLNGGASRDLLDGGAGKDVLHGGPGRDRLVGGSGADKLYGGTEDDQLTGGTGADLLSGGAGADLFIFTDPDDSPVGGGRDRIVDFQRGSDHIDLRAFDLDFGGTSGGADKVWYARIGDGSVVHADTNGNGRADLSVVLNGITALSVDDFLL